MNDQELERTDEVFAVNPGDKLLSAAGASTKTGAHEAEQGRKYSTPGRPHHHSASQGDLARTRNVGSEKRLLPTRSHIDAELPSRWNFRLSPSELSRGFIHIPIERMAINGCSAGIHPKRGGIDGFRDRLADQTRRLN